MKTKAEKLLRILQTGREVAVDGQVYLMQDGRLCVPYGEDRVVDTGISFAGFLKLAEKFDDDYLWLKGCECALQEIKREDSTNKFWK